jgi:hypothetical protein
MAKITGTEGMTTEQITMELQHGARFVQYQWCVSALVVTFKRFSEIQFVRAGESRVAKGMGWTLLTLLAGWWGIPWGPIFSGQALWVNLKGGKDLTPQVVMVLNLPLNPNSLYPENQMAAGAGK